MILQTAFTCSRQNVCPSGLLDSCDFACTFPVAPRNHLPIANKKSAGISVGERSCLLVCRSDFRLASSSSSDVGFSPFHSSPAYLVVQLVSPDIYKLNCILKVEIESLLFEQRKGRSCGREFATKLFAVSLGDARPKADSFFSFRLAG